MTVTSGELERLPAIRLVSAGKTAVAGLAVWTSDSDPGGVETVGPRPTCHDKVKVLALGVKSVTHPCPRHRHIQ